jgi:hypothetical protein
MKNSSDILAFEPATAEQDAGLHPTVSSYIALHRHYLAYYVGSLRDAGMDSGAIRQEVAGQKVELGKNVSLMQELIDGGMDSGEARKFIEQQRAEDAGYVPDPERDAVGHLLHNDRKQTAEEILARPDLSVEPDRLAA